MNSNEVNEISLSFGSDLAFIDLVQGVADNLSTLMGFEGDDLYWIGLSVREAVTNAVLHGNGRDRSKLVWVRFRIEADRLRISVCDQGVGILPQNLPDPLAPANLLKPGGRGIFFIRSFMDNVDFTSPPDGGHEIVMEKIRRVANQGEGNEN